MIRHYITIILNILTITSSIQSRKYIKSQLYTSILSNANLFYEKHLHSLLFSTSSNSIDDLLWSVRRGGSSNTRTRFYPRDYNHTRGFVEIFEDESEEESDLEYEEEELEEEQVVSRPVVYRYFGRSRTRTRPDESIPFILLGSNVDHWRNVGESLSSLGFNVIVCQRVLDKNQTNVEVEAFHDDEGASLIQAVLDALRWPKAVIVGCDVDAVIAMQAAMALSKHKQMVAGVILCGDLTQLENTIQKQMQSSSSHNIDQESTMPIVDTFLKNNVPCPAMIVWEGNNDNYIAKYNYDNDMRTVILGGGLTPHRRLPDQFAWSLSRFVEEKVVKHYANTTISTSSLKKHSWTFLQNNEMVALSPGTLLVAGRVVATTILYMSTASVLLYQYKKCKFMLSSLLHNVGKISVLQKRLWMFVAKILMEDWARKTKFLKRVSFFSRKNKFSDGNCTVIDNDDDDLNQYDILYGIDSVVT